MNLRKSTGKKRHWIGQFDNDTFQQRIFILWPADKKDVERFFKQQFGLTVTHSDQDDDEASCYDVKQFSANVIMLSSWHGTPRNYSILVHECVHAAINTLTSRGMKLSDDSDESYTYLTQHIFLNCLKLIRQAKGRKP